MRLEEVLVTIADHKKWLFEQENGRVGKKQGERADFSDQDLRHMYICNQDLTDAILVGTILDGVDSHNTNFTFSVLDGSEMRYMDLSNANLTEASLIACDLTGSNLKGAILEGADLTGAILTGCDLRGAEINQASLPIGPAGTFIADKQTCQQLVSQILSILVQSEEGSKEMLDAMYEYQKDGRMAKWFYDKTNPNNDKGALA